MTFLSENSDLLHSMARANLNKSKKVLTSTTTASKYIPKIPESVSVEIPPFRPHFINLLKTVFYEVNLVSQCSHLEVLLLSKFGSERGISIDADSGPLEYVF